jgi:murein L,D-transpeptidase YcbB/YkuD
MRFTAFFQSTIICAASLTIACGRGDLSKTERNWSPEKLQSVRDVPAEQIEAAIARRLAGPPPAPINNDRWGHAIRLYKMYGNNPLWLTSRGLHEQRTKALTNALLDAESDGMRMDAYPIGELAQSIAAVKESDHPTAEQLANADVLLTASFTALGEDMLTGQVDPRTVAQSWHVNPKEDNVDSSLVRDIRYSALDKSLATLRSTEEDYTGLRRELIHYRQIVANGGWQTLPNVKAVKPGGSLPPQIIQTLRARLAAEGYAVPEQQQQSNTAASGNYDHALAAAVAQFQSRHAITVDSTLRKETIDALNTSAAYRLAQIVANMERMRWLPRAFPDRYVFVNVPAFKLEAYDKGQKALEMKVIVGAEYEDRATPVFADSMETVVFRPYWLVPPKIQHNEYHDGVPEGFETYMEGGATRLRQRPGPKNALGLVKFLFPNDFNIYLHDTPNGELFKKDVRAFSHGCIRLEKPDLLALYVLGWPLDRIHDQMDNGPDDHSVKVPQKIPVYIVYETAYITNGQLYFGNDLYDRDDRLVQAVVKGAMPNPQTVQAVQALRRIAAR